MIAVNVKTLFCTACLLTALHLASTSAIAQGPVTAVNSDRLSADQPSEKIPWKLTVVILDGTDPVEKAEVPVKEAVSFIEQRSRFVFEVEYVVSSVRHGYTPYNTPRVKGKRPEYAYAMMGWNLPRRFVRNLPVSTSYLFLYKMNGRRPAQAGSALGLDFGLVIGGRPRPYATVPTDMHWFVNTPNQGFNSWAAQIVAHEIINTLQAKLEARPYRCGQLTGTPGVWAVQHEGERLASISEKCYSRVTRKRR
jgi:hypothetical protein